MKLFENFDYRDLKGQVIPIISVDEYKAKAGSDDDIVTIAFMVKGDQASNDLSDWFERGYDWVLDAQVSEGEYTPGKNLVFVEIPRRSSVPERIFELVDDLETLTDLKPTEWTVRIDDEEYDCNPEILKSVLILSPHEYRQEHEEDLNEMRKIAGIPVHNVFTGEKDIELKNFISKAGL